MKEEKEEDNQTFVIIISIIVSLTVLTFIIRNGSEYLISILGLSIVLWIYSLIIAMFVGILLFFILIASDTCGSSFNSK